MSAAPDGSLAEALAPLRTRPFAVLWLATVCGNVAAFMRDLANAWVASELSDSPAAVALILAAALALGAPVLPALFTDDQTVRSAIGVPWWFLVVQLPFAGVLFALDGVLIGAGDAAFMRTVTVVSAVAGFLPLTWLSLRFDWGLAGIWAGLSAFIGLRLVFGLWRTLSGRWAVPGPVE